MEAKPLQTKQVEADHFNQSTRVAQAVKSSTGSNVEHRVYQTHDKPTKQQEKALAIDSGVDRCASAWRKVEKFLKTQSHKPSFWFRGGVLLFSLFCSQGQDHKINAMTITFSN